jgi:hypothetical protein
MGRIEVARLDTGCLMGSNSKWVTLVEISSDSESRVCIEVWS